MTMPMLPNSTAQPQVVSPALDPLWVDEAIGHLDPDVVVRYAVLKGSRLFRINEFGADADIIIVFQRPTEQILGLRKPPHTIDTSFEASDGVLVDLKAYEIERFAHHMLSHNGNFVEGLCAPEGFYEHRDGTEALRAIGARYKTQRLHPFYRGYAFSQLKRASKQIKTAKGLIYTYREAFAGIHLLRTGEIVYDFRELAARTQELLSWESVVLPRLDNTRAEVGLRTVDRAWEEFGYLETALDESLPISPLPQTYDGSEKLNRLLLSWRSKGWKP